MAEQPDSSRWSRLLIVAAVAVVAISAAMSAAAVAADGTDRPSDQLFSHADGELEDVDRHLDSGGIYWQGQSVGFADSAGEIEAEQLLLREYDTTENELGALVREIEFDADQTTLETGDLDGTYVLVPSDRRDRVLDFENGTIVGTVDVEDAAAFEILVQTLEVRWAGGRSNTVETDRKLELTSNRARYNVNVSSPDLSFEELERAFMGDRLLRDRNGPYPDRRPFERRHRMYNAYEDEDVIVLRGFSDGSLRPDFSHIETFPDAVIVEVTDTGLSDTAKFSVESVDNGPFVVTELAVEERVMPGDPMTLSATIENRWRTTENREIVFELSDGTRTTVETTLAGESSTTVSVTLTAPAESGEVGYSITTAGDSVEGTVAVGEAEIDGTDKADETDETDESEESTDERDGLGYGLGLIDPQVVIGIVMTVLSLGTFLTWRRG